MGEERWWSRPRSVEVVVLKVGMKPCLWESESESESGDENGDENGDMGEGIQVFNNGKLINPWLSIKPYPSANRVMPVKMWGYQSVVSGWRFSLANRIVLIPLDWIDQWDNFRISVPGPRLERYSLRHESLITVVLLV